jgi:hypothetical protein
MKLIIGMNDRENWLYPYAESDDHDITVKSMHLNIGRKGERHSSLTVNDRVGEGNIQSEA